MIDFKFTINELPLSVNRMYKPKVSRYRGLYVQKNPLAGSFEYSASCEIKVPKEPFDQKLCISLIFEIKDKRKLKVCDVDNMLKCLFDSLQNIGIIKNDNLIYRIKDIEKRIGQKDRVIGHITEYVQ